MPYFEDFYAAKLRGSQGAADADEVLNLRLSDKAGGLAQLEQVLAQGARRPPRTIAVLLAAPPAGGGETLFQPVGRRLLDAKREGTLRHLSSLPAEDGLGFFILFEGGAAPQ